MRLQIQGLTKTYANGVAALQGIDLGVDRGLFGLLGPNGAGKSTLMRTIATLQAPDSGSITFDGHDVLRDPGALRKHLGYLPQDFGVYPGITALELLHHLAILKGVLDPARRTAQVDALLEQTNLTAHRRQAVSGFSGGMRQRFGIAQALLGDPRLLIVDEPTAGLDPEERNRFHNLLSDIGEDIVVLLSTHIVEDVRQLCPRLVVLANGRVQREGSPDDLIGALAGRVWERQAAKADLAGLRSRHRVLATHRSAGALRVRVLSDAAPGDGFAASSPDLEDAYFAALLDARAA